MATRGLKALSVLCALAASAHAQSGGDDPVPVYGPGTLPPPVRDLADPVRAPRSNLTRACRIDLGTPPRVAAGRTGELLLTFTARPGLALSAGDELEVRAEGPGLRFEEAATRHQSATVGRGLDWMVVRMPFTVDANARPGPLPIQVQATARLVRPPSGEDLGWMTDAFAARVDVVVEPALASRGDTARGAAPHRPSSADGTAPGACDPSTDSAGMARDLLHEPTAPPPAAPEPSPLAEPLKPGALGAVALLLAAAAAALLFRLRNAKPPTR